MDTGGGQVSGAEAAPGVRERKRAERIAQILDSSRRVFCEAGYVGYSMRKVADDAGLHLNSVQHFFGDLDALLLSTIHSVLSDFLAGFQRIAANGSLPPRDRLEGILEESLRAMNDPQLHVFMTQSWTVAVDSPGVARMIDRLYGEYENTLTGLVLEIAPDKRDAEARIHARLIASMIEGFVVVARYAPRDPPIGVVASQLKRACLSLFGTAPYLVGGAVVGRP
jgi:AcrR family transcriptional regulator